ncbi:hypothetical protein E4U19_000248, partial [Claviceps sp. Clav32 group G5]
MDSGPLQNTLAKILSSDHEELEFYRATDSKIALRLHRITTFNHANMEPIMNPQDCPKEATAQVPLANMVSVMNPEDSQEEATAQVPLANMVSVMNPEDSQEEATAQ